jgi:diguanylate cyclase (GGDEF)-like protein/PAS domain S-box-containing protein
LHVRILIAGCIGGLALVAVSWLRLWPWRVRRHYRAQERSYRNVVAQLPERITLAHARDGRIMDANAALVRASGYSLDELLALRLPELYPDLEFDAPELGELAAQPRECALRTRSGRIADVEITVTHLSDGGLPLVCVVARDIALRKQAEREQQDSRQKLSHLANHDPLTGLPNRLYLQSNLPQLLRNLPDNSQKLALLYVDVDHFKNINDSQGHDFGDQALNIVAARLRACTRAGDLVVRMGGDEFVVVATGLPEIATIAVVAEKILAALRGPVHLLDTTVSVSASIGIAVYPDDGSDLEPLLRHADIALYTAKDSGRNNYQFFSADMGAKLSEHVVLEQALRHAINSDQLYLEYQPIVDLNTGTLQSFEALCRWRNPLLGLIAPGRFIPVAERSGLIIPLGESVLRMACQQLRTWQDQGAPIVPIAVNVAPMQLTMGDFGLVVRTIVEELDVDPKWLRFEIVESTLLDGSERHIAMLSALRDMGSKIVIDDFGAGYSSFAYLKRLPVDTLKIDRSFIQDLCGGSADVAIIRGIVEMARNLRLHTVAEGVESAQQLQVLRELGCELAQGFHFSKPLPAESCRALLNLLSGHTRLSATVIRRALSVDPLLEAQVG